MSVALALLACDAPGPLRPEAGPCTVPPAADAGEVLGCPSLPERLACPGDDAGGDTWDSFARPFFAASCVRCHSVANVTPEERSDAPAGLNWDDESSVRANLDAIRSAIGVDNFMPPEPPAPSCEERRRMVRWIDSGAP